MPRCAPAISAWRFSCPILESRGSGSFLSLAPMRHVFGHAFRIAFASARLPQATYTPFATAAAAAPGLKSPNALHNRFPGSPGNCGIVRRNRPATQGGCGSQSPVGFRRPGKIRRFAGPRLIWRGTIFRWVISCHASRGSGRMSPKRHLHGIDMFFCMFFACFYGIKLKTVIRLTFATPSHIIAYMW